MMAILVPCFSLIWRERTKTHTKEECTLLADAVLKQSAVEQKRIEKSDQFLETYLCALNALSGWAWAYGGTDEAELNLIWKSAEYAPEGTAVLRNGGYMVLRGAFPEKDFLSALQKTRAEREKRAAEEEEGSSSVLLAEGDTVYLSSLLPQAGTEVISRLAAVPPMAVRVPPSTVTLPLLLSMPMLLHTVFRSLTRRFGVCLSSGTERKRLCLRTER